MFKSIAFVALAAASAFAAPTFDSGLSVRSGGPPFLNIHPIIDSTKCVGIVGGVYANGSQVDIYDCNGSDSQQWQWVGNSIRTFSFPVDTGFWCLDAGNVDEIQNGVQMKIWQCFDDLPQQTWTLPTSPATGTGSGPITLSVDDVCLDLTNGVDADRTILQVWQCAAGNPNQIWNVTFATFE